MEVSTSAYYTWCHVAATGNKTKPDHGLVDKVRKIFTDHKHCFGPRRLSEQLKKQDVAAERFKTRRIMIARQAHRNGDQAIVAWAVSGKRIPDPFANSFDLFGIVSEEPEVKQDHVNPSGTGQAFGQRLAKKLAGYPAELGSANEIVVMGLDSATPGRMAIGNYLLPRTMALNSLIELKHGIKNMLGIRIIVKTLSLLVRQLPRILLKLRLAVG